ncbi:hypothetical protein BOTBODRAFT_610203 [Botryobasidium botryosum FD-172 SS1]|uniref:Uncharacterized protein n=1 Tax=Botryobasidium botryosum (strain FD-172 SS1) TaxID=930990 RepID=A0A067LW98_BOTB1|nr:hypothetical protein BOTBODRAFT_610203 [Botryobasidium botryosum FD-172 SS1]
MVRQDTTFHAWSAFETTLLFFRDRETQTLHVSAPVLCGQKSPSARQIITGLTCASLLDLVARRKCEGWFEWDNAGRGTQQAPSGSLKGEFDESGDSAGYGSKRYGVSRSDGGDESCSDQTSPRKRQKSEVDTSQARELSGPFDDALYSLHLGGRQVSALQSRTLLC